MPEAAIEALVAAHSTAHDRDGGWGIDRAIGVRLVRTENIGLLTSRVTQSTSSLSTARRRPDWISDELVARRRELYVRAAPVFRKHGYRGATLKALASACGLSIPGLYRYFPSKRSFALYPLIALYPELHAPRPDATVGDPISRLSSWIEGAVAEMPHYILAARLSREVGLDDQEQRKADANLADHVAVLGDLARRAGPHLDDRAARELARTMVNVVLGPAITGLDPEPQALRRELRALLRGYGLFVHGSPRPLD